MHKNNSLVLQSGVFSLSIKDIQKGLTFIVGFFYFLKVIHILELLLALSIYFFIKLPINQCIYGYFSSSSWYLAFFIAYCISFLISKLIYRNILYNIKSHKVISKYYNQYLDINIFDSLLDIYLALRYVVAEVVLDTNLILLYNTPMSTAPALNWLLNKKMRVHEDELFRKAKGLRSRARTLENICGAMDKDRTDNRHGSLYDSFKEHIASSREEYDAILAEIRICRIYTSAPAWISYSRDAMLSPSRNLDWGYEHIMHYLSNSMKSFL